MHYPFNRHVQPRCQARDVMRVGLTRAGFEARERRGGHTCLIGDIAQAESLLFTAAANGAAEFGGIDSGLVNHGPEAYHRLVLAARLCFIVATKSSTKRRAGPAFSVITSLSLTAGSTAPALRPSPDPWHAA